MMFSKKEPKLLDNTSVSESFKKLAQKDQKSKSKIIEILEEFHENGILLAMVFFSLPVAVPLPYPPGFTTVMGLPLVILALQMLFGGKKVRLPNKINNYEIKNTTLKMISNKIVPIIESIEKYIKPRLSFAKSVYCEQFVGFACLVAALAVAIPLPLTNAIPALGITVMALGLLNRDGVVIIAGFLISLVGLAIAFSAVIASWIAIKYIFNSIF